MKPRMLCEWWTPFFIKSSKTKSCFCMQIEMLFCLDCPASRPDSSRQTYHGKANEGRSIGWNSRAGTACQDAGLTQWLGPKHWSEGTSKCNSPKGSNDASWPGNHTGNQKTKVTDGIFIIPQAGVLINLGLSFGRNFAVTAEIGSDC